MNKLFAWMKQHQVPAFYVLVFAISWPSMILIFWVLPPASPLQPLFGLAATFSPALIAVLISARAKSESHPGTCKARWVAFAVTWVLALAIMTLHIRQIRGIPISPEILVPTALAALLPAWLVSGACSRITGVRELLGTLLRPRGNILWYVVAFVTVPVYNSQAQA